jgi:dihydrofolate reductase
MSLDGFIAGPNAGPGNPLGDQGDRLHQWVYGLEGWRAQQGLAGGHKNRDDEVLQERNANVGAVVMGRGMFDTGEEPWGENPPFHAPVFVLTHRARDVLVREGGTSFTFVTDGLERAVERAKTAAGDKNVSIAGGAKIVQQALQAGLLDELQIHLAPVLVGDGIRLFDLQAPQHIELERMAVIDSPQVTHLKFRIVK